MRSRLIVRGLAVLAAVALVATGAWAAEDTIDFEALAKGEIVTQVFGAGGAGPIGVSGLNPRCDPALNAAVVFDTRLPDSDDDLGSPNETCAIPGPGVGIGGELGQPNENCDPRGNVLIVHETCSDLVGPGPVPSPDDADVPKARLDLDFSALGTVTIRSLLLMDVEAEEPNAELRLFNADNQQIASIVFEPTGDNGVQLELIERPGVARMEMRLNGSGAIDNIVFVYDREPECGDGELNQPGETCDPPGANSGEPNECRDDCTFCGDGVLDADEQCDDGNNADGDGCSATCEFEPACGDGELNQPGETCDPPGSNSGLPNECRDDCTFCGDGFLDVGEQCDDGNNLNGDGCSATCTHEPFCGDGILNQPGETCEPPGSNAGMPNECRQDCTFCGDGFLDVGEECDDGNNAAGDGCSPMCDVETGGEGCTPGYWRQDQHFDSWTGYLPSDLFDVVFGVDAPGNDTLLAAVWSRGGGENALQRHAVAALLNTSNPEVAYFYSTADVIAIVQNAYATGDFESAKDQLEAQNGDDTVCPLN